MEPSLKLGVAGLGTVGTGVLRLIAEHGDQMMAGCGRRIEVVAVSARSRNKDRGIELGGLTWHDDPISLARDPDVDCFVELIGGEEGAARAAVEAALGAGKSVVTANKALLAHHGVALAKAAEAKGVALKFEAAVAGGIPVIKTLRESLMSNRISRVYGILNGTCNYILTKMRLEGRSFDDVLKEAQAAGYAEADPTFDIGGWDTAHKLSLLTSLAFGTEVAFEEVYVEGIEGIRPADIEAADELGYRIKLLGVAMRTESGIEQRVHPAMIPKNTALAEVNGVTNAVAINGDYVGDLLLVGPGAGERATASSVVADILDIARGDVQPAFIQPATGLSPYTQAKMRAHEGGYYIRLSLYDVRGAFASIAGRMAEQDVSLESIVQRRKMSAPPGLRGRGEPGAATPVILITHETTEQQIRSALEAIERDGHVDEPPQMIRIEKL